MSDQRDRDPDVISLEERRYPSSITIEVTPFELLERRVRTLEALVMSLNARLKDCPHDVGGITIPSGNERGVDVEGG